MDYAISPGLYAVGNPTADSPVLISANYKMSFDRLRGQLGRLDAWILVLDTRGINVWCAAGKGTFSTDELVGRIASQRLGEVVSHRKLIVPQLGAPGVAAHEVRRRSGFRVVYGPVRAEDLPAFLAAGMQAAPAMRQVRFALADRLAVVPVELVLSAKYVAAIAVGFFLLAGLGRDGFDWQRVLDSGTTSAVLWVATCFGSAVLVPALLPWLPGRALALKGLWLGGAFVAGLAACYAQVPELTGNAVSFAAWCVIILVTASFLAMNFSGATTYTSLSGVRREMRVAVPLQFAGTVVGGVLWIVGRFV